MILALDPGVTTGWAVLTLTGAILDTGNWRPEDIESGLSGVSGRYPQLLKDAIVEKFPLAPSGDLAQTLREVVATIELGLSEAGIEKHTVTPGVWKTSSIEKSPLKFAGERTTPHQRDAIRMGRWFARKRRSEQLAANEPAPGFLEQPPLTTGGQGSE